MPDFSKKGYRYEREQEGKAILDKNKKKEEEKSKTQKEIDDNNPYKNIEGLDIEEGKNV